MHSYGLCSYGLHGYGLHSHGLHRYGLNRYGEDFEVATAADVEACRDMAGPRRTAG